MIGRVSALAVALGGLTAAGCGADGSPTSATDGAAIFKDSGCGGCHTLSAADAHGRTGPDLDEARPDAATVAARVRDGGGGMPAFGGRLTDAQIRAVAAYVADRAGR